MTHASLPYHIYVNVNNRHLGPNMPDGVTKGLWHAVHSRPGQILMCHVLLETGAHWSGLPLHALSTSSTFGNPNVLMPWGSMGEVLIMANTPYLEGLEVSTQCERKYQGRHTGIMIDWADGFSRYPQEHKPLNLIASNNGPFMLLPNNYVLFYDKHFTSTKKQNETHFYRRNEDVYWESSNNDNIPSTNTSAT